MKNNTLLAIISTLWIAVGCFHYGGGENRNNAASSDNVEQEEENDATIKKEIKGSFIQGWLAYSWDVSRWDKEMAMLSEAGMEYLILSPCLLTEKNGEVISLYPTILANNGKSYSVVEKCLESAQKKGLKIFLGINANPIWWNSDITEEWLLGQMALGNQVIDELTDLYKDRYPDSFYGWYWDWEVDNLNWKALEKQQMLSKALNMNLKHLSEKAPGMPLLLSPFMNYKCGSAEEYRKIWENVLADTDFRDGDIFCPQDCVGAGGLNIEMVDEWFSQLGKAVRKESGLNFWANIEIFDKWWTSAPLPRVIQQINNVGPNVEALICFAYSHYYSPYVVRDEYHKVYLQLCKDKKVPTIPLPEKLISVKKSQTGSGIVLTWIPKSGSEIDGLMIYKNGSLTARLQAKPLLPDKWEDTEGTATDLYQVAAYNVIGAESARVDAIISQ